MPVSLEAENIVNGFNFFVDTKDPDELKALTKEIVLLIREESAGVDSFEPDDYSDKHHLMCGNFYSFLLENEYDSATAVMLVRYAMTDLQLAAFASKVPLFDDFYKAHGQYILSDEFARLYSEQL